MLLQEVWNNTEEYMNTVAKERRKSIGQFFTSQETAIYMASFIQCTTENVRVLDPGAGSGILSAAAVQKLCENKITKSIQLTVYETDPNIIALLRKNINTMCKYCNDREVSLTATIQQENFITGNDKLWGRLSAELYDVVICNPPYKKISKDCAETKVMASIVHGQPNLYFLFMAMSVQLLSVGGAFVFIVPRSWTSGSYFTQFRKWFFQKVNLRQIHLFVSRNEVFDKEQVLQETMILYGKKEPQKETVNICTSIGTRDFAARTVLAVPQKSCIQTFNGFYLLLPTTKEDLKVLNKISRFDKCVSERGYQFRTGLVVDFRHKSKLRKRASEKTAPLFWPCNFVEGRIQHPIKNDIKQFIVAQGTSLLMANKNYLLIKRLAAKEEKRRLQPALYREISGVEFVSTENHLNYLYKREAELTDEERFAFFVILSSSLWDSYYRILNGSTQVNAAELNSMPVPCFEDLMAIGRLAIERDVRTTEECDRLLEEFYENR